MGRCVLWAGASYAWCVLWAGASYALVRLMDRCVLCAGASYEPVHLTGREIRYVNINVCGGCVLYKKHAKGALHEEQHKFRRWHSFSYPEGYRWQKILCVTQEVLVKYSIHWFQNSSDTWGADNSLARPTSRCVCLIFRIFRLMLVLLYV